MQSDTFTNICFDAESSFAAPVPVRPSLNIHKIEEDPFLFLSNEQDDMHAAPSQAVKVKSSVRGTPNLYNVLQSSLMQSMSSPLMLDYNTPMPMVITSPYVQANENSIMDDGSRLETSSDLHWMRSGTGKRRRSSQHINSSPLFTSTTMANLAPQSAMYGNQMSPLFSNLGMTTAYYAQRPPKLAMPPVRGKKDPPNSASSANDADAYQSFLEKSSKLDFSNVTVHELKCLLKSVEQPSAGRKCELIDRIKQFKEKYKNYRL